MAATGGPFDRVEPFTVTVPAKTPKASPVEFQTTFTPGRVVMLEVDVPPGHNGLTGFSIAQAHQPIYPSVAGQFVVANGRTFAWDMHDDIDSGNWQIFAYNLSQLPHSFYLQFYVVELSKIAAYDAPILTPLSL